MAIEDYGTAKAWLEGKPREVQVAFAARCALRGLPGLAFVNLAALRELALPVLRATLTSGLVATGRLSESGEALYAVSELVEIIAGADNARRAAAKSAIRSAHAAAESIERPTFAAAESAAESARAVAHFALSIDPSASKIARLNANTPYSAAGYDSGALDQDKDIEALFRIPLWPANSSDWSWGDFASGLRKFLASDPVWGFWARWYDGMLKGEPLPWDLQQAVALIPDEDWAEGPERIAEKIREIEQLFATGVTPGLIRIEGETWDVEPSPKIPEEPLEFAIGSVEQSLQSALKLCSPNLFNHESDEVVIIQSALGNYPNNPSLLAVAFWQACMSFQANIGAEYPKDDANLVGLQNTLYTAIEEMCEHSEVIRKRIGRLAALVPKRELTSEDQSDLQALANETQEHLTKQAQSELEEAVGQVSGSKKPARGGLARLANWVTTLGKGLDEGQRHEKRAKWLIDLGRRLMRVFFPGDGEG